MHSAERIAMWVVLGLIVFYLFFKHSSGFAPAPVIMPQPLNPEPQKSRSKSSKSPPPTIQMMPPPTGTIMPQMPPQTTQMMPPPTGTIMPQMPPPPTQMMPPQTTQMIQPAAIYAYSPKSGMGSELSANKIHEIQEAPQQAMYDGRIAETQAAPQNLYGVRIAKTQAEPKYENLFDGIYDNLPADPQEMSAELTRRLDERTRAANKFMSNS